LPSNKISAIRLGLYRESGWWGGLFSLNGNSLFGRISVSNIASTNNNVYAWGSEDYSPMGWMPLSDGTYYLRDVNEGNAGVVSIVLKVLNLEDKI